MKKWEEKLDVWFVYLMKTPSVIVVGFRPSAPCSFITKVPYPR